MFSAAFVAWIHTWLHLAVVWIKVDMSDAVASADEVDIGVNCVDKNWKDEIIIDFFVDKSTGHVNI